ncbi:MBL fold metallo-hydrolase [Candidatus Babeliales bacterium]|nr:MBL fold metallo-hydrolase [Candidatus Babeliales bacterium]MCF7899853.1 MBL fold metallo-hydrolase [Candidatus Babeliales bacterium]
MKIKILGTRGEIEPSTPYHKRHSGILIDNKIMIDIGEKEFLKYKPKAIFITHLHPDHAFFVRLKKIQNIELLKKLNIYAPEKEDFDFINIISKTKTIENYKITPIKTEHSLKVKSQGYLIEKNNQKIFYTGDLFWIKKENQKKLKKVSLVITEASFLQKNGLIKRHKGSPPFGHTGIPNLINFFKPFTNNILFMHFGSWFYNYGAKKARKKLKDMGSQNNINIVVGYDGQEVNLKKNIKK